MKEKKESEHRKLPCKWNSKTMYQFEDDGVIKVVCAYDELGVGKAVGELHLDDFYYSGNNMAFVSYCDDFLYESETGEIGCEMGFTTPSGRKRMAVYRQSLGDLFDVLFCIRFGGLGGKTPGNDEDGSVFGYLLILYRHLLDREAPGKKWTFLSRHAERFQSVCENAESPDDVISFIVNAMCLRKPKKS